MSVQAVEAQAVDKAGSEPACWSPSDDRLVFTLLGRPELADLPRARDRAEHRVRLAPWLSAPMLATPGAQDRVKQWVDDGGLTRAPESPETLRQRIRDSLWVVGDERVSDTMRAVLETLPLVVIDDVLRNFIVVAVAPGGTKGIMAGFPLARAVGEERPVLIGVTGTHDDLDDVERTCAHEIAHGFLEARATVSALPATPDECYGTTRKLMSLADVWARPQIAIDAVSDATAEAERRERRACRLAASWGFGLSAGQEWGCVRGNAARVAAELQGRR